MASEPGAAGGSPREQRPVRRPRHLLDPDDLRGSHLRTAGSQEALSNVQRWVLSTLAMVTILHLAAGAAVAAVVTEHHRMDARVGLNVIAAVVGVIAVAAAMLIHRKNPLSWWLILGLLPGVVGAWFTFR